MAITSAGMAEVAKLIGTDTAGGAAAFDYIAIGTGTVAANVADTTLGEEAYRIAGAGTTTQTAYANDTFQLVSNFSITGTHAITEAGVLNAASNGTLLCRAVFAELNVVNGDSLTFTFKIQVKQGS
jgi:hypothetical protein